MDETVALGNGHVEENVESLASAPAPVTKAFTANLGEVTLLTTGETILLPRLTGRRMIDTAREVAALVRGIKENLPQHATLDPKAPNAGLELVAMMFDVLPAIIEFVHPVVAKYLARPQAEIEEWDIQNIMEVAAIFFTTSLQSGSTFLNRLGVSPANFASGALGSPGQAA